MSADVPILNGHGWIGTVRRGKRDLTGRDIGTVKDSSGQCWPVMRIEGWPRRSSAAVVTDTHTYVTARWPRRITDEQLRGIATVMLRRHSINPPISRLDR